MRYMGSKAKLAKEILPIMLAEREGRQWVEPFVGGGNIIQFVEGARLGFDIHPYVIACLDAASKGWLPKETYSELDYKQAKTRMQSGDTSSIVEDGYIGFACCFGGTFFNTYARSKDTYGNPRDMANEQYRAALKQFPLLNGISFSCCSFETIELNELSLVYCDPPYKGTSKYTAGELNYDLFFEWCCSLVDKGHTVFVSEYEINHPRFKLVWEKQVKSSIRRSSSETRAERLYKVV
jgi:DNA adenine methylase